MKSILLSIRPEQVAKILNRKQTTIVRKKFPKDYIGWVYIYCTKDKPYLVDDLGFYVLSHNHKQWVNSIVNGKVVARFWCDKVEELKFDNEYDIYEYKTETLREVDLVNKSFIAPFMLYDYLKGKNGYAIYISKLEVFDEPRELFEFNFYIGGCHLCKDCLFVKQGKKCDTYHCNSLIKAPQNYCYIEELENDKNI